MGLVPWLVNLTLDATPDRAFGARDEEAIKSLERDLSPQVMTRTARRLAVRLRVFADSEAKAKESAEAIIAKRIPQAIWTVAAATAQRDLPPMPTHVLLPPDSLSALSLKPTNFEARAISPLRELGAYEVLWDEPDVSFKTLSEKFKSKPEAIPSDFVEWKRAFEYAAFVLQRFRKAQVGRFGVRVHGAGEYPKRLRDAAYPVELLYYQGWWDLVESPSVAVVGTRKPTPEGIRRTRRLVKALVKDGWTIVSGLAAGIDTVAHKTAIAEGGRTIAVLGTPLSRVYPRPNADLQARIAKEFLVISQVPVKRYERQPYWLNRRFFPERNITMSALTAGTIIVEAGETSGTLIQARAALEQRRKLFILDSVFRNDRLTWPRRFEEQGAIRVVEYDDIRQHLPPPVYSDR